MNRSLPVTIAIALLASGFSYAADFDLGAATNQGGLDLYRQLAAEGPAGNLAISPYSIESALAQAYAGADGNTRRTSALHLHVDSGSGAEIFSYEVITRGRVFPFARPQAACLSRPTGLGSHRA